MGLIVDVLLVFVAVYPVCTASIWMAGGLMFRWIDEPSSAAEPNEGWPGVSVLIPAYNEAGVIGFCVEAALALDYPELEVLVLDDGSTDETEAAAVSAAAGDPRCRVVRDPANIGKAERLNAGLNEARYDLVAITDADTHVHPQALKRLVARMGRNPLVAAVAGAPHVTNRGTLLLTMQVLEAAAIVGLIRRTQSLSGRVGVVAGVLGLFHRERVLAVGGFNPRMATEDIDLSWKLLLAGWETLYEPRALVGMQVPSTLGGLWAQRKRWARGQGHVLHVHLREMWRLRNRRLWPLVIESIGSLLWVVCLVIGAVITVLGVVTGGIESFSFALAWGIAIAVVATLQVIVALALESPYDRTLPRAFLVGALYPIAYWTITAAAALRSETVGLALGPRGERVLWDLARDRMESASAPVDRPTSKT